MSLEPSHALCAWLCLAAAVVAIGAVAAGTALAVSSSAPSAAPSSGSLVVRIGQLQNPDNLNPFIGIQGLDYQIWHLNYDFLVGFDAKTLAPRPELATKWSVSPDGKTWTFTTRQGVKWQDGVPFTAADVAFTFNYIVKNDLSNLAVYTDGITGAKATGPNTVEVYTSAPKANMLRMVVPILPAAHLVEDLGQGGQPRPSRTSRRSWAPAPSRSSSWQTGKYVHLKANPNYWGGAPHISDLYILTYTNADTMASDLKLGNIDAAVDVPFAEFKALSSVKGIQTSKAASWQFSELAFNCYASPNSKGNPVLRDQVFRQALNYAIDRNKIVSTAFNGYAMPGSSLIVPYSPYHWQPPADMAFTYDPAKANQMLDAAGYKKGADGYRTTKQGKPLTLRLMVTTDSPANEVAGKLAVQWFKDVGVRVDAVDRRPGRADQRPVPVHRQHLHAQLGHVHVVLDPGRRPGLHGEHLHAAPVDRLRLERLPVDRPGLHQALQRGRDHDRPGAAHPARAAGPAGLLHRLAVRDHGLPLPARGLEHEQVDGLDQGARRAWARPSTTTTTSTPTGTWRSTRPPPRAPAAPRAA